MGGIVITGEARARLFNALYHLSLEHFCSLTHLLNKDLNASAAALLRPQYEATIRGLYFQEYATDKAIGKFISGESVPTMATLVGAITTELDKRKGSSFYLFFGKMEDMMNEFTHGGMHQVNRRFSESELISNYNEATKLILVATSLIQARLAVICALNAAGKEDDAQKILIDALG